MGRNGRNEDEVLRIVVRFHSISEKRYPQSPMAVESPTRRPVIHSGRQARRSIDGASQYWTRIQSKKERQRRNSKGQEDLNAKQPFSMHRLKDDGLRLQPLLLTIPSPTGRADIRSRIHSKIPDSTRLVDHHWSRRRGTILHKSGGFADRQVSPFHPLYPVNPGSCAPEW
jgi:hypothetical protein